MLLLPAAASKFFQSIFRFPAEFVDKSGDLYRVDECGRIYVHWEQDGPTRYTKEGAYIGTFNQK
jgi:hypothetical protein